MTFAIKGGDGCFKSLFGYIGNGNSAIKGGGEGGGTPSSKCREIFFHFFSTSLTLLRLSWVSSSSLSRMDILDKRWKVDPGH